MVFRVVTDVEMRLASFQATTLRGSGAYFGMSLAAFLAFLAW